MSKIREDEKAAMMERNRDARRSSMPAVNGGGGLTRRRQQRTTNLRDSPEEDRDMEMQEPPRLRDRGIRKDEDRDRDRSSLRSKRRRGDRLMHGSNREDGDDTSEESTDNEEDDEDEDATVVVRLPPSNSLPTPSSSSSIQQQLQQQGNQHHVRKSSSFPAKTVRPPPPATWKVAEEVIGVSVPRKARTSSMKRSQECWVSGEMTHRQASTSPSRPSPSSATAVSQAAAISPSSSNVSVRKKKPISVSKHRPPKMTKSSAASSSIQEIEIEVAEVLYGMTRQAPPSSNNKEESSSKVESKETNGLSTEARPQTPMAATVPKRKRPRPKIDEESPSRMESEVPSKTEETAAGSTSPRSEKMLSVSPAVENGVGSSAPMTDGHQDSDFKGLVEGKEQSRVKEEAAVTLASKSKEADSEVKTDEVTTQAASETLPANESPQEEKFNIDLMAPPPLPEKSAEEKSLAQEKKIVVEYDTLNREAAENAEKSSKNEVLMPPDDRNAGKLLAEEFGKRKQQQILKEKAPESQLEQDKDGLTIGSSSNKRQQQVPKQQLKQSARVEPKQEKPVQSASLPLPVSMPGWPGGFPYFGYVGQGPPLQAVLPMDGSTSGSAKTLPAPPHLIQSQPMPRPKRCSTHLYIAQNIHYHQQIARMNPLWPSPSATAAVVPAATAPVYGGAAKQYNLNSVPPSDSSAAILGNSLQVGGFPQRSLDKSTPAAVAMVYTGPPPIEKGSSSPALAATNSSNAANAYMEQAAQAKQQFLIQQSQSGASPAPHNMIHGPAFIFPISQQPSSVANHRLGGASPSLKPNAPVSNAPASSGSLTPGHSTSATTTLSFNYPGLSPNDAPGAQYMAIVPNNATYSFPIAAAQVGGPPSYRGAGGATAASPGGQTAIPFMPFLTPPQQQQLQQKQWQHQLQQQQQQQQQQLVQKQSMNQQLIQMQQLSSSSQSHPKPTTSAGSSTSQKHTHHQSQHRQQQHLGPPTHDDSPSTADSSSRVSQAQKSIYGTQNFAAMSSMHSPQNFASISSPRAGGGAHNEDKNQQQAMNLSPQAAYAMSFAPFGGGFTAATGAATPAGLDFPAIVQNPAPFQDLPEVPRHGYQIATAAAAAAVALQQHKKAAHLEEGKSGGDPRSNANVATTTEEGKKNNAASVSHSLSFSRPGNDPSPVPSSNILNALSENVNNARALNSSTASGSAMATSASNPPSPQQQQQMIQFRKQQQQVLQYQQLQHHQMQMINMKNSATHNSGAPASTMGARFPQGGLQGFPPSLIQQGGGNTDAAISLQWKAAAAASGMRTTTPPAALAASSATTTSSSSAKNQQIPQHQQLQSNKPLGGAHQTHISFGVTSSSNKPLGGAGSPQNSLSKTSAASGGGENSENSPRTSSSFKPGQPTGSIQQQQAAAAASLNKSSSLSSPIPNMNNMTTTSILGHHLHIIPSSTSTTSTTTNKSQHSQLQQSQKQSCFQQQQQPPPHNFNNPYIQQQASSSVAGGTFTYRDQQAHQLIRERQEEHKSRSNSSVEASPSVTGRTVTYQEQIEQLQLQRLHHQAELEKQESKSRSNSSVEVGGSNPAHRRQVDQVDHMKQQQQQLEQVKQQQQKSNHAAAAAELLHKRQLEMVKQKSNQAATELQKPHQKAMQQGQPSPRQQIELEILKQQQQNNNNKSTTQQAKASSTTSQSHPPANHAVIMQLQKQLHQNNLPTQQGKTATATTSTATKPNNVTVIQRQHLENYEQIRKQQHQNSTSSGMLSLSSSSASPVRDSTAGKTPGSVKAQQYPAGAFMSSRPPVMSAGFPYIHTMPPPSSAPGKLSSAAATDQKQPTATRKDNVHASWKPEKR